MNALRTAIIHYSSPPVVGGVEAVIAAHAEVLRRAAYPVVVISGRGSAEALPEGVSFHSIPEVDSQHPSVLAVSRALEEGRVPEEFQTLSALLVEELERSLAGIDALIVHNVFTKHFNLPLTAALSSYLSRHESVRCLAWCHDFSWTSAHSRPLVHEGYPWNLLKRRAAGATYVTVSERRRSELAGLLGCGEEEIAVVYNGVDAPTLLGLWGTGLDLVERLGLLDCDLGLLMPVRVTQAKNAELALRITAALKERGVDPRVILTGPPDPHDPASMGYFESLRELRSELGVEREMRFVYESGPDAHRPFEIGMGVVAQLYRACDVLFMPSHREGFGMPILEAGTLGMPIVATAMPAVEELASEAALIFDPDVDPGELAERLLGFVRSTPALRFRIRARRDLTWRAIFRRQIEPLLTGGGGPASAGGRR